jgi:hypothetical protein
MPTWFHHGLFSAYWVIALIFGICLIVALWKERDYGIKATAAMMLVPVILRLLLIK